jgi:hypothetical protein
MPDIKGLKIELTLTSENLPPAFAEAATRRQVAPLCQRGVIPPFGIFSLPKAGKGRWGGILRINVIIIVRLFINDDRYPTASNILTDSPESSIENPSNTLNPAALYKHGTYDAWRHF